MTKYDNFVNSFLHKQIFESVLSIPRDSLDPTVFQFFDDGRLPILQDVIKKQILVEMDKINNLIPIDKFFIIGSILTNQYDEDSDIDVNIEIDVSETDSIDSANILHLLVKINGAYADGTTHKINYHIMTEEYDLDKAEAAYDIVNERWIKSPASINPDIQNFLSKVQTTFQDIDVTTGEIRRNVIDIEKLKRMGRVDLKHIHYLLNKKLEETQESIKKIVSTYEDVKMLRGMAFDRTMTPQEIREFGNKNRLPENIIYKMLEKYYYIKLMKHLKEIIGKKEQLGLKDIKDVKDATKEFYG